MAACFPTSFLLIGMIIKNVSNPLTQTAGFLLAAGFMSSTFWVTAPSLLVLEWLGSFLLPKLVTRGHCGFPRAKSPEWMMPSVTNTVSLIASFHSRPIFHLSLLGQSSLNRGLRHGMLTHFSNCWEILPSQKWEGHREHLGLEDYPETCLPPSVGYVVLLKTVGGSLLPAKWYSNSFFSGIQGSVAWYLSLLLALSPTVLLTSLHTITYVILGSHSVGAFSIGLTWPLSLSIKWGGWTRWCLRSLPTLKPMIPAFSTRALRGRSDLGRGGWSRLSPPFLLNLWVPKTC